VLLAGAALALLLIPFLVHAGLPAPPGPPVAVLLAGALLSALAAVRSARRRSLQALPAWPGRDARPRVILPFLLVFRTAQGDMAFWRRDLSRDQFRHLSVQARWARPVAPDTKIPSAGVMRHFSRNLLSWRRRAGELLRARPVIHPDASTRGRQTLTDE
jgi:hypothetical protein